MVWVMDPVRYHEFLVFWGGVLRSGGVWDEEGDCLVWISGEVVAGCRFCQIFPWFGPWLPLGIVRFWSLGVFQGLEGSGRRRGLG